MEEFDMKKIIILTLFLLLLSACGLESEPAELVTLRLMTHDSFDISEVTMNQFIEE